MNWFSTTFSIQTEKQGLLNFTRQVQEQIEGWQVRTGMAFLFVPHTSASLVVNESYDPTARRDLESYLSHVAPEGQDWHVHTLEGADDSPAHVRTMITPISLTVPIDYGKLSLGAWQGIYLAEHRRRGHLRQVYLRVLAVE